MRCDRRNIGDEMHRTVDPTWRVQPKAYGAAYRQSGAPPKDERRATSQTLPAGAEGLKQRRFTHGPLRELPIGSVCQEQKLQLTGPSERSERMVLVDRCLNSALSAPSDGNYCRMSRNDLAAASHRSARDRSAWRASRATRPARPMPETNIDRVPIPITLMHIARGQRTCKTYSMPFRNRRLSWDGRAWRLRSQGSSTPMVAHYASDTSP